MLFRYFAARLRHWDPAVVGYLNMGLGIEQRAQRLAPFWAEHMQRTRSAQARWAENIHGDWLTVLGAGRLLDFNKTVLLPRFRNFRLVDADPLCRAVWKNLPKPVDPVHVDISGCLDAWIRQLRKVRKPWPVMLDAIRAVRAPQAYSAKGDALLSLNILSQLQIVWQDRAEDLLNRRFGVAFVKAHEAEWLEALRPGGQTLVEQHLAALEKSSAPNVLLITDLDYIEYQGVTFQEDHWAPPPVEWSPETGWCADEQLTCELSPALEGVELNEDTFARWMPSYRLAWQESWLWHLVPLGTEKQQRAGKVHRVGAFALESPR